MEMGYEDGNGTGPLSSVDLILTHCVPAQTNTQNSRPYHHETTSAGRIATMLKGNGAACPHHLVPHSDMARKEGFSTL